jgi:asparagine synthase (glutamine-hydrolysing)
VLQIPDSYKLTETPKSLLVDSLGDLLPRTIVDRKKMGFVLPFEKWMRSELRDFCNSRLNSLAELGLFNADTLLSKWRQFEHGTGGVRWSELWHLVVLTDWLETNKF